MLLTHTSGLAYDITSPEIKQWIKFTGLSGSAHIKNCTYPLVFEPGTSWIYGVGIDWAGQIVERLNNCTLGEYMEKVILGPLGMTSTTFHPENHPDIESRMASLALRLPDGTLSAMKHIFAIPAEHDLGGAGLYSTPTDYIKALVALLQGGGGILKPESVDGILKPRLSKEVADVHRRFIVNAPPELNFGLSVSIATIPRPEMRAPGTVTWGGLPCLTWWVDRETGIAATIFQQTFPPRDPLALEFASKFEAALYKHVRA